MQWVTIETSWRLSDALSYGNHPSWCKLIISRREAWISPPISANRPPQTFCRITKIDDIRKQGDTIGGKISCFINNCPVGLG